MADSPSERLMQEYSLAFADFDDTTLARWMAQTLGQMQGKLWRFSHPLIGAYRLASETAHQRQIWLKHLVNVPAGFSIASCCRAPALPVFSRDILQSGLICEHCSETLTPFDEFPAELQPGLQQWAEKYAAVHAVAHLEEDQRGNMEQYESACEDAARQAENLLAFAATRLLPPFLELYPAVIWEDQDECLEVMPYDIVPA